MIKRNFKIVISTFVILTTILSCKKYEDDTFIHLRTPEARLKGKWILTGGDTYDSDKECFFEFSKGGDFTESITNSNGQTTTTGGSWQLTYNKESIEIDLDGTTSIDQYDILKLSNSKMRLKKENGKIYEFECY